MQYPRRLCLSALIAALLAVPSMAQESSAPPREVIERTADELDKLLGPIALHPDDLLAVMLPAAAAPTDIVLAARFLDGKGDPGTIEEQPWDESVRALANFPDVIDWMNENLSWTQQVGDVFLAQPAAVMQSIQRLRARAYAAGTLRDTPQQRVLVDGQVIRIVSAEENVVYVPTYDTKVVYVDRTPSYHAPYITFGIGWTIGRWHRWECDWYSHRVWIWDNHDTWRHHRRHYYHHTHHVYRPSYRYVSGGRAWYPPPVRVRRHYHNVHHPRRDIIHPGRYAENPARWRYHGGRPDGRPGRDHVRGDHRDRDRNRNNSDRRSIRHGVILPATPPAEKPASVTRPAPTRDTSRDYLTRSRNRPPGPAATTNRDRRSHATRSTTPATPREPTAVTAPAPTPIQAPGYTTSAPREVRRPAAASNPAAVQASRNSTPSQRVSAPPRATNPATVNRAAAVQRSHTTSTPSQVSAPPRATSAPSRQAAETSKGSRDYLQRSRSKPADSNRGGESNSGGRGSNRGR